MKRNTHYIERECGTDLGYVDTLMVLWEGNDLPTFGRREPYFFDDLPVAERVVQRLAARFPATDPIPGVMAALPITYRIRTIEWDDESCTCCGKHPDHCNRRNVQHIAQFYCAGEVTTTGTISPAQCGASQLACNIVNATFLSLDGFDAMRKQMQGTTYTAEQFAGELARIVDRELRSHVLHANRELGS